MNPFTVIIWTCVGIFAATALMLFAQWVGVPHVKIPDAYVPKLVNGLVIQVVAIGLGAFGSYTYSVTHDKNQIPVEKLLVVEDGEPILVKDGTDAIWVRASDVKLCVRKDPNARDGDKCEDQYAMLSFAAAPTMAGARQLKLHPSELKQVSMNGVDYSVSYNDMGKLHARVGEPQSRHKDFILLAMQR
jgi:hypothetical protein